MGEKKEPDRENGTGALSVTATSVFPSNREGLRTLLRRNGSCLFSMLAPGGELSSCKVRIEGFRIWSLRARGGGLAVRQSSDLISSPYICILSS